MAHPTDPRLDPLSGFGPEGRMHDRADLSADEERIALVEERAVISKRQVDQGGVRVSTRTETLTETVRVSLEDLAVDVEHVPVGRFVDAATEPVTEGDLTILPVYEERIILEKRLYLVEEVHVRRRRQTREVEMPVELRRQTAAVERLAAEVAAEASPGISPDPQGPNPT